MNKRILICFSITILLLIGILGGCKKDTIQEGVTLSIDTVLPLPNELLLEPQEGYGLYCLVFTVENLSDYEMPFSAPDDVSFLPENSVSILYGGYNRFGYKTRENISPHGRAQLALAFMTSELDAIEAITYSTKQLGKDKNVKLPADMSELLDESWISDVK